jgi:hypothetical protein
MVRSVAILVLLASPLGLAQTGYQNSDRLKTEAALSTASLSAKLKEVNQPTALDAEQRLRASKGLVAQIHQAVDTYIIGTSDGHVGINRDRMARDLKQILGDTVVSEPAAFLLESPHGRSLVVFYAIGAGTAMTGSTTLRAYQLSGNRATLAGTTGSDMDGYGDLWVKRLSSPALPHELWLLVGGQAFGANGPNIRMRGYAYDGEKFATKWMPANVWGTFTVTLTGRGFRVDGPYYQDDKQRHEAYLVAEDGGLYLCRPRQCD